MIGIKELRQTTENNWIAKYQGNYGIYTIKISTKGKKIVDFSCSCSSDYYPCKHIPMVEKAIAQKIAINEEQEKDDTPQLEDYIKNVSLEKLRDFIIKQAKYNSELLNALLIEFASNVENTKGNKYSNIIKNVLASFSSTYEGDYYDEEYQEIEELEQWIKKAWNCIESKKYEDAILISKAIIEEYSQWLGNIDEDFSYVLSYEYQSEPFEIIQQALEHGDKNELFNYCLTEMDKEKYVDTEFIDGFHQLLESLALTVDPYAFITMQDRLLADIEDKSSREAKKILERKINFFKRLGQEEKAWALIKENMQIESFCLDVVNKKIEERDFPAAKKIINELLEERKKDARFYNNDNWHRLLLDIAQKEKDKPAIKELAYGFIRNEFREEYYKIYKAVFDPDEWAEEREKLITHYSKKNYFSISVADFLVAENDSGRLVKYIEKYPTVNNLDKYFTILSYDYPEKTLDLFIKAIDSYAGAHTGRSHYEYILSLLKKISKINGGKKAALDLVAVFKQNYKGRRAMMEVMGKFK